MERSHRPLAGRALRGACLLTIAAGVFACLPSLGIPIGLAAEGDALDYRLPILKWIARHHSYPSWSWTYVDDYPMLGELLMLPFFLVKQELSRIVPILAYLGAALFAALAGTELAEPPTERERRDLTLFLVAGILGFQPLLVQACHVMVDNVANCFALGALLFALRRRPAAAGAFTALALATRYSAWGTAPAAFLALFLAERGNPRRGRDLAMLTLVGSLGALPFLVRNLVLNANPFYPLLDGLFHGIPFTEPNGWGRGNGLRALLLFPYDLFYTNSFVSDLFDTKGAPGTFYSYALGFLTYLQLGGLAVALWLARASLRSDLARAVKSPLVQATAGFWLVSFAFWWAGSQILRYFGPGLVLIDLAILLPVARRLPRGTLAVLALLPMLSIARVQGESWRIALGREASFRDGAYAQSAFDCFRRVRPASDAVVGYRSRDGLNGYFDFDFVFLPPNNLYRQLPGTEAPRPDYIFSGFDTSPVAGYRPWPAERPCLLKRI